jgi:hypothetical protein
MGANMGAFPLWHWLILFLIIGIPILAVALEKSDHRTSRSELAIWFFGIVIGIPVVLTAVGLSSEGVAAACALLGVVINFFFYQRVVRRARDAGMGKLIPYLSTIPLLGWAAIVILLCKGPAQTGATPETTEQAPSRNAGARG